MGDITAATLWQAQLDVPGRVNPAEPAVRRKAIRGEKLFKEIGCGTCHTPVLRLNDRHFVEPNPYNPDDTFKDTRQAVSFDLTKDGAGRRLERTASGGAVVRAYTDLKRHNLCDPLGQPGAIRHFCNEQLPQGRPAQEFFLTRKLWDVGNSAPYGHRGDLTTMCEAILAHGGESRAIRDAFAALSRDDQTSVVAFLRTLQVLPQSAPKPRPQNVFSSLIKDAQN